MLSVSYSVHVIAKMNIKMINVFSRSEQLVKLLKSVGSRLTIQCSDGTLEQSQLILQLFLYHHYDNLILKIQDDHVVILPDISLIQYSQGTSSLCHEAIEALFPETEPNKYHEEIFSDRDSDNAQGDRTSHEEVLHDRDPDNSQDDSILHEGVPLNMTSDNSLDDRIIQEEVVSNRDPDNSQEERIIHEEVILINDRDDSQEDRTMRDRKVTTVKDKSGDKFTVNYGFDCSFCEKSFGDKNNLKDHIKLNHELHRRVKCKVSGCDKSYTAKNSLRLHVEVDHKGRKFICNYCDKIFRQQHNLKLHLNKAHKNSDHEKELDKTQDINCFDCSYCVESFQFKKHLDKHIDLTHSTRFHCSVNGCKKSYTAKSSLKDHIEVEHKGRKIKCNFCDKTVKNISHLKTHTGRSHPDKVKLFECNDCNFVTDKILAFKSHQKLHEPLKTT